MATTSQDRHARAIAELRDCCPQLDAANTVVSLSSGMTRLRDLLLVRVGEDVERRVGTDSMISSISVSEWQKRAHAASVEVEAYSCFLVDDEVAASALAEMPEDKSLIDWLVGFRLGVAAEMVRDKRLEYYSHQTPEERRLTFVSLLHRTMPQSVKAPLVLFRLFPLAMRITAAVAFGDVLRAQELRAAQCRLLPAIGDCHECHGRVQDNDEQCRCCGNPLWRFEWLESD